MLLRFSFARVIHRLSHVSTRDLLDYSPPEERPLVVGEAELTLVGEVVQPFVCEVRFVLVGVGARCGAWGFCGVICGGGASGPPLFLGV